MNLPFIKIQNLGNDYVYIDAKSISRLKISYSKLAQKISHRNYGVGSDGLFIVDITGKSSAAVRMFNPDGSEMELCGNGLRGTALYLRKEHQMRSQRLVISTRWKDYNLDYVKSIKNSILFKADLGFPIFESNAVGYTGDSVNALGLKIKAGSSHRTLYCVAMPNPHAVIFVDNFDFNWQTEGEIIEGSPLFKNRINVMFTQVISKNKINMLPWERGVGPTMACGSGAAAATVVSGLLEMTKGVVNVIMPGGKLKTSWDIKSNNVLQEGLSEIAFSGNIRV